MNTNCAYCGREYGEMGDDMGTYADGKRWCGTCRLPARDPEVILSELIQRLDAARRDYWNRPSDKPVDVRISKADWTRNVRHIAFLDMEDALNAARSFTQAYVEERRELRGDGS